MTDEEVTEADAPTEDVTFYETTGNIGEPDEDEIKEDEE